MLRFLSYGRRSGREPFRGCVAIFASSNASFATQAGSPIPFGMSFNLSVANSQCLCLTANKTKNNSLDFLILNYFYFLNHP